MTNHFVNNNSQVGGLLSRNGGSPNDSLLVTTAVVARMLNVSERTVSNLAARGEIPRVKVGRATRFSRNDILAFIENKKG